MQASPECCTLSRATGREDRCSSSSYKAEREARALCGKRNPVNAKPFDKGGEFGTPFSKHAPEHLVVSYCLSWLEVTEVLFSRNFH